MPGRILIVDDIPPNIKLLEAKLTSEYYDVITAGNGYRALELAKSESPDIILLDVMMPGLDGFQVCERLKADPLTAHIPVIIVTALSDAADRVRGLEAGADDFLSKPVRDAPLFARVSSLIRLKNLMDAWRVREETSSRLGFMTPTPLLGQMDATHGRVLIVEDSAIDAANLADALALDRHETIACASLEEGLQRVHLESFDLLIVSLQIQSGDVLRFCSQVRSHVNEKIRLMPILLLAEDEGDIERIAKGLDLGINDYVMRPIDRQELLARVRTQIRRQRFQNRLRMNYEESIALASTDPLTGAYNRRYLNAHLDQMLQLSHKTKKSLAIAFCDIDHFKQLNDAYGHAAGDEVLIEFAHRLSRYLRNLDLVARIGGEEFVIVMPDTSGERAVRIAERLRRKIKSDPFTVTGFDPLHITISIGVTTIGESDGAGFDILRRADEAMYRAKNSGRNRVVQAMPDNRGGATTFVQFSPT